MPRKNLKDMLGSAALTVLKPKEPRTVTVDAEIVDDSKNHLTSAIAPSLAVTKVFDSAPEMRGLFQDYFGFDVGNIAAMSPQALGELTEMINQANLFNEMLPVIEKNIKDYITAKVNYDKFVMNCVKAGANGMKTIDEATLQVFLEHKGYQLNREKLAKKADNKVLEMEASRDNAFDLSDYSLQAALTIKAKALAMAKENIDKRPEEAKAAAEKQQAVNQRKQDIKNLITGSGGKK